MNSDNKESETQWEQYGNANNPIWKHYKKSVAKNKSSNRFQAQCNYCLCEMDGKTQHMYKHFLSVCKKTTFEVRSTLVNANVNTKSPPEVEEVKCSSSTGIKSTQ
jgi:cyclopropane fatty-acyl-phospholipid synthase-like methyltransferase